MSNTYLLDFELTTQSEIFLGKKISANNFQTHDYLPASTLKGALLTQLRELLCKEDPTVPCELCPKNTICEFPQLRSEPFIVRPGCATTKNECKSHSLIPRNPLTISKCKICGSSIDLTAKFIQNTPLSRRCDTCREKRPLKKLYKTYCLDCKEVLDPPPKTLRTNIAIDSDLGTTFRGMLFFYEVILRNTLFKSQIITKSPLLKQYLYKLKTITIGRGRSRGLGYSKPSFTELDYEKQLETIQNTVQEAYSKTNLISFVSITNLCSIELSDKLYSSPYIQTIPLQDNSLKLQLCRSFGNSEICSGWALNTDSQKPRFLTATPGSVFCYKPSTLLQPADFKTIALLELVGLGESPLILNSYNQIHFLGN
ncbi:MAG: RAMP superfamily CRISPR-associated protein [Candidatus Helarchaeota archaeon]